MSQLTMHIIFTLQKHSFSHIPISIIIDYLVSIIELYNKCPMFKAMYRMVTQYPEGINWFCYGILRIEWPVVVDDAFKVDLLDLHKKSINQLNWKDEYFLLSLYDAISKPYKISHHNLTVFFNIHINNVVINIVHTNPLPTWIFPEYYEEQYNKLKRLALVPKACKYPIKSTSKYTIVCGKTCIGKYCDNH